MTFRNIHSLLDRYLSKWAILTMDVLIATMASLISLGVVSLWNKTMFSSVSLPLSWGLGAACISALSFLLWRTYLCIIRHTSIREVGTLLCSVLTKEAAMGLLIVTLPWLDNLRHLRGSEIALLLTLDLMVTLVGCIGARVIMILLYDQVRTRISGYEKRGRVLVFGIGDKSVALVKRLAQSPHYEMAGFIVRGASSTNQIIAGFHVYNFENVRDLIRLNHSNYIKGILFAREEDARQEQKSSFFKDCADASMKVLLAPTIDEVIGGRFMRNNVREIKIEDLLGRPEIEIPLKDVASEFAGKTILVTGAAGSIGSELCRQLAEFGVGRLILFDNAETPTHNIRLELEERFPTLDFVPVIGDVRQTERLEHVFSTFRPQIVFHAAAYKHVPLMEENPCEAVAVNVGGSRNVADKCLEYDVEKMVMISTDKAVNPTNIMGCTKRLAEIYVQSLGISLEQGRRKGKTVFVTTRFGNVLGSNGSVIPRFRQQIAKGGPVTVTHPDITRFFMTIPEACRLVMEAAVMADGTQIFVFDMGRSVKIADLARRMIELAGLEPEKDIKIEYTGLRPGEKLYEEVLSSAENTLPTSHRRIRIARVREYSYDAALEAVSHLGRLANRVMIEEMVKLMKLTVPEFVSKNSEFERLDSVHVDGADDALMD